MATGVMGEATTARAGIGGRRQRLLSMWRSKERAGWLPVALLFAALAALNFATLLRTPPAFVDEAWNANRSWGLLHTGQAFGTMDAGVFNLYDGYWTYFPWLGSAIHAVSIALFGPTLFAMRIVSLVFGLVLLGAVFSIARTLYGRREGFFAVGVTAFSWGFLYSSHLGRHDVISAALGFVAIAMCLADRTPGFSWKCGLAGLLVALTLDIHENGIIYIPAIGVLFLLEYGLGIFKSRRFWSYAAGVALGGLYFLLMHLAQYPATYFGLFSLSNGSVRTPPATDPLAWSSALAVTFGRMGWLLVPVVAVAFIFLLARRSPADKRLLAIFTSVVVLFALVVGVKKGFYDVIMIPAAGLLVGVLVAQVSRQPVRGNLVVALRAAAVASLVGSWAILNLWSFYSVDFKGDYDLATRKVAAGITPQATIMGPQTYWFAVPNSTYYSWEQLVYYMRYKPGSTLEDAFRFLHPDYFVMDDFLDGAVLDTTGTPADKLPLLYLPESALSRFLDKHARLVSSTTTPTFGNVRVYKLDYTAP